MKTCAIIAEYNPFHNGHFHQINTIKKELGCDNIVVIMSGDFTQRGIPAICDKAIRTKIALENGTSAVIELPVIFSSSSAQLFARGAVKILSSLNFIDYLVYGIESYNNNEIIKKAASTIISNEDEYNYHLKKFKQQGLSYPASCEAAFHKLNNSDNLQNKLFDNNCDKQKTHNDYRELFKPNNILGIEYEKALIEFNSKIKTYAIKRRGNDYSSLSLDNPFVSAGALRHGFLTNEITEDDLIRFMPESAVEILYSKIKNQETIFIDDFSEMILIKLMELTNDNLDILDLSEDILNKIKNNLNKYKSASQFVSEIKTRDYTYNRLMRVLCHILLNIKTNDLSLAFSSDNSMYARILGFNTNSSEILREMKKKSSIPIITNVKDGEKIISKDALSIFQKDIFASNIYNAVCRMKSGADTKNEYQYQIVKA